MKKLVVVTLGIALTFGLIGCNVSKPYITETNRTDQAISGNRGYLKGTPPPEAERNGLKRQLITVDIDLPEIQGKPTQKTRLVAGGMEKVTDAINEVGNEPSGTAGSGSGADTK